MIRTTAAAAVLGVSPSTLRSWEHRFGFPVPRRTPGGHRVFEREEIEALRAALAAGEGVAGAIALAQARGAGPSSPARLREALGRFDAAAADRLLEESLGLRSVERTVEEVLLPGVEEVAVRHGDGSAEHAAAFRWATGWLAAATRLAPPAAPGRAGVLVFDAAAPPDLDALHAAALELVLRRRGVPVLTLTAATDPDRLARAVRAIAPCAVVLTGARIALHDVGRLVHAVRRAEGGADALLVDFRGPVPASGASTVARLPRSPLPAAAALLDAVERPAALAV